MPLQSSEDRRPGRSAKRPPQTAARVDSMFRVFADRTRLRILRLLQGGPLCVGDLVEILRAPQPTVSRHLAYLRRSGFVGARQHGLWMFYELADARNAVHRQLLLCLEECDGLLPEAKGDAARARAVRRSGGCCPEGHRLMDQFQRGRS
jgi:ArsR family transcriptional regulator